MDSVLVEIGVKTMKGVIFTIRVCFRSVCDHPFLVGFLCFLLLLYKSFPFIFFFLLSASPILLCTAILLGTLLSYGEPNIPEIELEETKNHESVESKTGFSSDDTVLQTSESFFVEKITEGLTGKADVLRDDDGTCDAENLRDVELSDGESIDAKVELGDSTSRDGGGGLGLLESNYSFVKLNDQLESGDEKSEASSFDSERVNVDSLDSLPRSPWRRFHDQGGDDEMELQGEDHENREEDYDPLDSDSDHAESSSPDASMADIMPMLDELHPLLDEEAPLPLDLAHEGSDAASEGSSADLESDVESGDHYELEAVEDENEDDENEDEDEDEEEEEDGQGEKEEQTKSAIAWTEEDQKNLMDLGSSEIERNQRLENLIMRRRARKNMSLLHEMNLIDLESSDLNIAPISTRRQNPFDVMNGSSDISGLPPIPGSAPSVLLPRRNPFDIPYDLGEEKPNLTGEFQDELITIQPKEAFFRRHESFNVGPSIFGLSKMRPYFVPERTFGEDSSISYSPFRRQLSELSDSRVSSIPESESQASLESESQDNQHKVEETKEVTDEDVFMMKQVIEEGPSVEPESILQLGEVSGDDLHETRLLDRVSEYVHPEIMSQDTEEDGSMMKEVIEEGPSVESELVSEIGEDGLHETPLLESKMVSVSEHVGHGSQSSSSSSDEDPMEPDEVGNGDLKELWLENGVKTPTVVYHSSSSSLSEECEKIFLLKETEAPSEPVIEIQSDIGAPHREPVYDSSPREINKNLSSSLISSDVHPEKKEKVSDYEVDEENRCNLERLPVSETTHKVTESMSIHDVNNDSSVVDQSSESEHFSASLIPAKSSLEEAQPEEMKISVSAKHSPELGKLTFDGEASEEMLQSPDSDADVYHEASEKLITTPSAEGNTSLFYDKALHAHRFKHISELKGHSKTTVECSEDAESDQKHDVPLIQEVDQDIQSNVESPLSPDFISSPSTVSEIANSYMEVQTNIGLPSESKEIDGLLSELDHVSDFSIEHQKSETIGNEVTETLSEESISQVRNVILHDESVVENIEVTSTVAAEKSHEAPVEPAALESNPVSKNSSGIHSDENQTNPREADSSKEILVHDLIESPELNVDEPEEVDREKSMNHGEFEVKEFSDNESSSMSVAESHETEKLDSTTTPAKGKRKGSKSSSSSSSLSSSDSDKELDSTTTHAKGKGKGKRKSSVSSSSSDSDKELDSTTTPAKGKGSKSSSSSDSDKE